MVTISNVLDSSGYHRAKLRLKQFNHQEQQQKLMKTKTKLGPEEEPTAIPMMDEIQTKGQDLIDAIRIAGLTPGRENALILQVEELTWTCQQSFDHYQQAWHTKWSTLKDEQAEKIKTLEEAQQQVQQQLVEVQADLVTQTQTLRQEHEEALGREKLEKLTKRHDEWKRQLIRKFKERQNNLTFHPMTSTNVNDSMEELLVHWDDEYQEILTRREIECHQNQRTIFELQTKVAKLDEQARVCRSQHRTAQVALRESQEGRLEASANAEHFESLYGELLCLYETQSTDHSKQVLELMTKEQHQTSRQDAQVTELRMQSQDQVHQLEFQHRRTLERKDRRILELQHQLYFLKAKMKSAEQSLLELDQGDIPIIDDDLATSSPEEQE